jgi:hypothetical protein
MGTGQSKPMSPMPPISINPNSGVGVNEKSDFEFADIIIFNTILTDSQVTDIYNLMDLVYRDNPR